MQPLILAEQTRQGVADFLETTFPATTPGFEDLVARFLAEQGNLTNWINSAGLGLQPLDKIKTGKRIFRGGLMMSNAA